MTKADFIAYLNTRVPLGELEQQLLQELLIEKHFAKGDLLLETGAISSEIIYVASGCVRMFYEVGGEEKTTHFYLDQDFVSAYESYMHLTPSPYSFQALNPTDTIIINREGAEQMLAASPAFETLARLYLEEELIVYQKIIASFITLTPEERYLAFLEDRPELTQQVPQHYIASYLGVSAETLSRIKKRIYLKRQKS